MTDRSEYMRKWQASYRKRLAKEGGRRIMIDLTPEANAALKREMERTGKTARAVVCGLLENL